MFDFFVLLGLAGSLFFTAPNYMGDDEAFTFYALIFIIILSFFFPKKRTLDFHHYGLPLLWAFITAVYLWNPPVLAVLNNFLIGILAVRVIAERTDLKYENIGRILVCAGVFVYFVIFFQAVHFDPFYIRNPEISGPFLRPWMMGCFAVLAVPFVYRSNAVTCTAFFSMAVLSQSWTCTLGFIVIFTLMFPETILRRLWRWFLLAFLLGIDYLLFFGHDFDTARTQAWTRSFEYIRNLIMGNGLGSWAHEAFIKANGETVYHWRWAHNEVYQYFFEQGFIGLLLLIWWAAVLLYRADKTGRVFFLAVLGLSMAHPIFHFGRLAYLLILGLALTARDQRKRISEKSEKRETIGCQVL